MQWLYMTLDFSNNHQTKNSYTCYCSFHKKYVFDLRVMKVAGTTGTPGCN